MKYFLLALLFAGCSEVVNVPNSNQADKGILEINITAQGEYIVYDFIDVEAWGDNVTVSFDGFTDAGAGDYIAMASISGWNGEQWITLEILEGNQINTEYNKSFLNHYTIIRLYAALWSDEETNDTSTIKLSNIIIQ